MLTAGDLLSRNLQVFQPIVDDKGLDLLVLDEYNNPITVQVKAHKYRQTQSSIAVNVKSTGADVIAVPFDGQVLYIKNRRKNVRWQISISVGKPRNGQKKGINRFEEYLVFPPL